MQYQFLDINEPHLLCDTEHPRVSGDGGSDVEGGMLVGDFGPDCILTTE